MRRFRSLLPLAIVVALAAHACGRSGALDGGGDDDDRTTWPTRTPPLTPVPTPTPVLLAAVGDIVMNEVYFHATGCVIAACDANRSGTVNAFADQFVEVVSVATDLRSLAGIGIHEKDGDPVAARFTFGTNAILAPGGSAIVFGDFEGTTPAAADFDGALLFEVVGPADLDFTDVHDFAELRREGEIFATVVWGGTTNAAPVAAFSLTLNPDLEAAAYSTHPATFHPAGTQRNTSPGWRVDYTPFAAE